MPIRFTTSLLWLAFAGASVPAQTAPPSPTIRINLGKEKAPVPPTLCGIFMEEISHRFSGGIYAELIRDRSFEEGVLSPGMKLVTKQNGSLRLELDSLPASVPPNKWNMPWPWNMNCGWDTKRALLGWSLLNEGGAKGENCGKSFSVTLPPSSVNVLRVPVSAQ